MRHFFCFLALVVGLTAGTAMARPRPRVPGSIATIRTPARIQDDAFRRANDSGKLVMFVYTRLSPTTSEGQATTFLTTRNTRLVASHFLLTSIYISGEDDRYERYRDALEVDDAPYWFLVTPGGELVAGGGVSTIGDDGNGSWNQTVVAAAASHPPIGAQDRRAIGQALQTAPADLAEGNYEAVARIVPKLRMVWYTPDLAERSLALCEAFDAKVDELLTGPAQLLADNEILQAAQAYAQLVETFSPETETGQQIQETLDALLEEYPDVRDQMDGDVAGPDDPPSPPPTDQRDPPQEVRSTDGASDEPTSDEDQAQSLIQLARMYHNREMTDKAKTKLQECIDKYPDTEAAGRAAALLEEW